MISFSSKLPAARKITKGDERPQQTHNSCGRLTCFRALEDEFAQVAVAHEVRDNGRSAEIGAVLVREVLHAEHIDVLR